MPSFLSQNVDEVVTPRKTFLFDCEGGGRLVILYLKVEGNIFLLGTHKGVYATIFGYACGLIGSSTSYLDKTVKYPIKLK